MASKQTIEQVRDKVYDRADKLTDTSAQKLFETAFTNELGEYDADTRDELFDLAKREMLSLSDTVHWPSVFNSYVELFQLVQEIHAPQPPQAEEALTDLALEVYKASNRLSTLFYLLRTNKDLSEDEGRSLIEAAFPLAIRGLTSDVRKQIFKYVYERNSGSGWAAVAESYSDLTDLVARVKPDGVTVVDSQG